MVYQGHVDSEGEERPGIGGEVDGKAEPTVPTRARIWMPNAPRSLLPADHCLDLKLKFSSSPRGSGLHQIEVHISGLLDARNEKERHLLLERVRTVLESHGPEIVDHIENLAFQEERAMED